jgi:hypothetical protein
MSHVQIGEDYEDWGGETWRTGADDAVTGLRLVLSDAYGDASDVEMADALDAVMGAMSPAEAFDFGKAFSQIARGAGQAFSDPAVASVARTVLPVAGSVLGTAVGGPVGTALGGQLGTLAANALPAPRPAGPTVRPPGPAATPAPPAAGGSTPAAQALVLAGNPLMQHALASAAMGQHGQPQVAGIPVAQLLGLLGRLVGQAAAEADELRYLGGEGADAADTESEGDAWSPEGEQELYTRLVDAENLDLAEAMDLVEVTS